MSKVEITLATTDGGDRLVAKEGRRYRELLPDGISLNDLVQLSDLTTGEFVDVKATRSPLRPSKIVAVGLNYMDHVHETGMAVPDRPLLFAKFPSALIDDGEAIEVDSSLVQRVDWEAELGVVIGRRARGVSQEAAMQHVFGYVAANDVSARDLQFDDGQWIRGKNLDTFCPVSSTVVTRDEITDPQNLMLGTRVNGQDVQVSNTKNMIFAVDLIVSYCSRYFTLEPGDLIITGTPWGCGEFMDPRRSLSPGDTVEVWVEAVGTVANPVSDPRIR